MNVRVDALPEQAVPVAAQAAADVMKVAAEVVVPAAVKVDAAVMSAAAAGLAAVRTSVIQVDAGQPKVTAAILVADGKTLSSAAEKPRWTISLTPCIG